MEVRRRSKVPWNFCRHGPWILYCCCLLAFLTVISQSKVDYWSEDFDEEANCKQADLINTELKKKDQCQHVETGADVQAAFDECKLRLQKKLILSCSDTKIRKPGQLLYCKARSMTECCFVNHTCAPSWDAINMNFSQLARLYMTDRNESMEEIEKVGYQKCHHTGSYEVDKCYEDCKAAEGGEFAKNCTDSGGLFKCCIRRDKIDCHDCRFCCSLLMCAIKTSQGVHNKGKKKLATQDQRNEFSALDIFNTPRRLYKSRDYRCLKPDPSKKSSDWAHYVHEEYQHAATKDELDKVNTIEFDVNFMNFEDPAVLERFTGPDYVKHWKQTYGFDFVAKPKEIYSVIENGTNKTVLDQTEVAEHCLKSEFSTYAEKCRKNGGFYKCCYNEYQLDVYELISIELGHLNVSAPPSKLLCDGEKKWKDCHIFAVSHICTKKDPLSGSYETTFETSAEPKYQVGGFPSDDPKWAGVRTDFCMFYNTCQNFAVRFSHNLYEKAYDKESLCAAAHDTLEGKGKSRNDTQAVIADLDKGCKTQKSTTVYICENDALTVDGRAKNTTAYFRNLLKKLLKKKKKNKSKKEKKKKKKSSKKGKRKAKKKDKAKNDDKDDAEEDEKTKDKDKDTKEDEKKKKKDKGMDESADTKEDTKKKDKDRDKESKEDKDKTERSVERRDYNDDARDYAESSAQSMPKAVQAKERKKAKLRSRTTNRRKKKSTTKQSAAS